MAKKTSKKNNESGTRNSLENKFFNETEDKLTKTNLKKKKKLKLEYETEKLPYVLPSPIRRYIPDFIIRNPDGSVKMYIEVKGYFRPEDRTKMIAVKTNNPGIDIRMIFPQDNKLHAKTETRYSDWCKKHGFKYAIGHVPEDWFR
jgi:predicted nuclease of restriction endonuclease-like RecB superfamily